MFFFCIVPPRWIVEPTDVNVERNKHAVIDCQADGVPTPILLWKKAVGVNHLNLFFNNYLFFFISFIVPILSFFAPVLFLIISNMLFL